MTAPEQFDPLPGHKIQTGPNILTVNDFECLRLDTYAWPSERVHCELQEDETWLWIVEHFDDLNCTVPNVALPVITHGTDCFYFATNHSYRDTCNANRTLTISAWHGAGCRVPMPLTAMNLPPTPPTPAALVPAPDIPETALLVVASALVSSLFTGWCTWRHARQKAAQQAQLQQRVESAIARSSVEQSAAAPDIDGGSV